MPHEVLTSGAAQAQDTGFPLHAGSLGANVIPVQKNMQTVPTASPFSLFSALLCYSKIGFLTFGCEVMMQGL